MQKCFKSPLGKYTNKKNQFGQKLSDENIGWEPFFAGKTYSLVPAVDSGGVSFTSDHITAIPMEAVENKVLRHVAVGVDHGGVME